MSKFYCKCLFAAVLIATAVVFSSCERTSHRKTESTHLSDRSGRVITASIDSCEFFYGSDECMLFIERSGEVITAYISSGKAKSLQSGKRVAFQWVASTRSSDSGHWEIVGVTK